MEEVLPEWILNLARKAKEKAGDAFTPPEDVQQTVDFVKQEMARNRAPLPGFFDKLPRPGEIVTGLALDTAKDATTLGGTAMNFLPELKGAGILAGIARRGGRPISNLGPLDMAKGVLRFEKELPESMRHAMQPYVDRYGQVLARTDPEIHADRTRGNVGEFLPAPSNIHGNVGTVRIHPVVLDKGTAFDQTSILGHELEHGNQALQLGHQRPSGIKNTPFTDVSEFQREYEVELDQFGYGLHPKELRSRAAGLEGANTQFWGNRNTPEQPLIPEAVTPEGIRTWAEGAAVPFMDWKTTAGSIPVTAETRPLMNLYLSGSSSARHGVPPSFNPRVNDATQAIAQPTLPLSGRFFAPSASGPPDEAALRRALAQEKFGSSPMPSANTPARTRPHFGKNWDEVAERERNNRRMARSRQNRREEQAAGTAPTPKGVDAFAADGNIVEADELRSLYGIDKPTRTKVYLRVGSKDPAVIIARAPMGHGAKGEFTYELHPVSAEVMDALLTRSQRLLAGKKR